MTPRPQTENLAYLAGYFEGEGSIYFHNRKSPMLYISVITGDKCIIEFFAANFGGKVEGPRNLKGRKRAIYLWRQSGEQAQETLRQLSPYFRIKQTLAFLALTPVFNTRGIKTTDAEKDIRERIAEQVSAINNRVTIDA